MGIGYQLVLVIFFGAIFSPLFIAFELTDNQYLNWIFIIIAAIIAQRVVVRFYKYKISKKKN